MLEKFSLSLADEPTTQSDKSKIRRSLERNEQSPSVRVSSEANQFFQEIITDLGNPYDVTRIPISVLQQMQRDPMLGFGLFFKYAPIYRANWYIKCERADIAAFVDNALRQIYGAYLSQRKQSAAFGFAPIVKRFQLENPNWTYLDPQKSDDELPVWNNGNIKAITWKPFIGLPSDPSLVQPRWSGKGEFNGIKYSGGGLPVPFAEAQSNSKDIDVRHSLWVTNEKESVHGSLWGYPLLGYAYRYWWSYWFNWALCDRFSERKADPPNYIYYPTGSGGDYTSEEDADPVSMKALALGIIEQARSGGSLALPGDTITGYDDRPTSVREWQVGEIEVKGDIDHFMKKFEYLDVMKLRSLFIPEQALIEGSGGTSSRNVAKEEINIHKEAAATLSEDIDLELNRYVIPDLVKANFPDFDGEVRKITTGFSEADQDVMEQALQWIGQNDTSALRHVDIRALLDRLGMPLVSHKEIRRQEEAAKKALEESTPKVIDPDEEGNAAVTEFGQYVQGRSHIFLGEDSDFISKLPKSRHYKDKVILSNTRKLRKLWKESYFDIYENFATYLSKKKDVSLAEDDAEKLADRLVNGWKYPRTKLEKLVNASEELVQKVIGKAGEVELRRIRTNPDWNVDSESVASYLEDRGAVYVKAVDDTVRTELKTYLANVIREGKSHDEIVEGVREHFSGFESWKADRLVRTEIRDAYNFATLTAGEQVGIKIVQIRDAQLGEDKSDDHCVERNGEFMKIGEALSEVLNEHPNGTVEVVLTKRDNLSIQRVEQMPNDDSKLAYFDDGSSTVYLKNDIPKEIEESYLISLGEVLENE